MVAIHTDDIPLEEQIIEAPLVPMSDDLKKSALLLSPGQVRNLVGYYYQVQDYRMQAASQVKAASESGEPNEFLNWTLKNMQRTESAVKSALTVWADQFVICQWSQSIYRIGPVISAALNAYIDIKQAPTVGHIWHYAGVAGSDQVWLGKEKAAKLVADVMGPRGFDARLAGELEQRAGRKPGTLANLLMGVDQKNYRATITTFLSKRPWNASLKTLVFKIGTSIVYGANRPEDVYGRYYKGYKERQTRMNDEHRFAEQAAAQLREKNFGNNPTRVFLEKGMLPPAQIHARSIRYVAKLFLSHWHWVRYELEYGTAPRNPYAVDYMGHSEIIPPPNWRNGQVVLL